MNWNEIFSPQEWNDLKDFMKGLGSYLPNDKTNYIWDSYRRITKSTEKQPCSCPSSGKLWARAIKEIEAYIKTQV
jgi:hypothetical protein